MVATIRVPINPPPVGSYGANHTRNLAFPGQGSDA